MPTYPYEVPALQVDQPMGTYYVALLPAALLLDVCFSDRLRAYKEEDGPYRLAGTQRGIDEKRLKAIGSFVSRADAAFPNAVILATNKRPADGLLEEEDERRWSVRPDERCGHVLRIPSREKLAAIIDGQHRIFGFAHASEARLLMPMVCSIFFDLPKPFQAQLFATINSTQKPVDRSLTYELFGYNVMEEAEKYWSPDKVAVFFARKLNTEQDSPLASRIAIAPASDFDTDGGPASWRVSMATVVEGILRLISTNPKADANALLSPERKTRDALRATGRTDRSPLRDVYLEGNDQLLYVIVRNYLRACADELWGPAREGSFIVKTVGVQALFDILRELATTVVAAREASVAFFRSRLRAAHDIDFADVRFRNASGVGRTEIKRALRAALGLP